MDLFFETRVLQNPLLGATLLWHFSREYFKTTEQAEGPDLPKTLLVLPFAFHRKTVVTLRGMQKNSGLLKALADNPFVSIGLQTRIQALVNCTEVSILIGRKAGLFSFDKSSPWPRLIPRAKRKTLPKELEPTTAEVGDMHKAVARLGWWLPQMDAQQIYSLLGVTL